MRLTDLTIHHFRNIGALTWSPAPGLNLVWGDNGEGKTNLLEAVHLALVGRSFRTRSEEECLPWGREEDPADPTLAEVTLESRPGLRRLRVVLGRGSKRAYADGQMLPRLADLWGMAAVVTFTPDDATLFKGPPSQRRRFLDIVLSQTSHAYLEHLQRYGQALRQLNAALKTQPPRRELMTTAEAFFPVLAASGAAVMLARAARLAEAAEPTRERHAALGGAGALDIAYDPDLAILSEADELGRTRTREELEAAYLARLTASLDEAWRLGSCPHGIHRDDFALRLEGRDLRRFGSQGQHRLAALTLKLEAARWIELQNGEPPLLLLDDFGSELDPKRREAVLAGLRETMQVFITATHPGDLGDGRIWERACRIEGGQLHEGTD